MDLFSGDYRVIQTLAALDGPLFNPSALEVLAASGSRLEVVVSSAGLDQLFVFVTPDGPDLPPGRPAVEELGLTDLTLPPTPNPDTRAEATPPAGAPLALVITLVVGVLPPGEVALTEADSGRTVPLPTSDTEAPLVAAASLPGGTDDVEADGTEPETPPREGGVGSGVDDPPGQLDLYERTRVPDDGPQTRNAPGARPEFREIALSVAETASEVLPAWLGAARGALVGVPDPLQLRVVSEALQGASQPPQVPVTAGDLPARPEPAVRVTGMPAERGADQPRPEEPTEVVAGDSWQDEHAVVAGGLLLPPEREWLVEKGWLLALAVGGAAWHLRLRPLLEADERAGGNLSPFPNLPRLQQGRRRQRRPG
jgi:hypothetical protein